jgi:hypothetical protein
MPLSKDYEEFLQEFKFRQNSLYEKLCNFSEIIFPITPPGNEKFEKAIDFAHINITPKGAFGFAILFSILFPLIFLFIGFVLNILYSGAYLMIIAIFSVTIFWFLYNLPQTLATSFRIKASSEMVLAIVYMSIAMKVVPNLEYAIKFAGTNLTGPLARDLKKIMWDVYTGKFVSVADALDPFMEKWKRENEEFVKALFLIKSSFFETAEKRNKVLSEAINVALNGTKERMKGYAQEMKAPLTVLNAIGILLPIIGLVFFPIMTIFLPNLIQPAFLVIGYNILLPVVIYWMMKTYLEKRPATFHQPNLSKYKGSAGMKFLSPVFIISLIIPIALTAYSYYGYNIETAANHTFNTALLFYSMIATWGISGGIIIYAILSTMGKTKLRKEIVEIESELGEVLFQLGTQVTRGMPIENALKTSIPRLKELKISKMVERILYNMESFGMTFNAAVFDKEAGAINYYPSNLIEAVMRAVTEISKGGMSALSDAMLAISTYLKNMHDVEEELKNLLEDVSSTMNMQALILAPLSSGIVVSMSALVIRLLTVLKVSLDKIQSSLSGLGPMSAAGTGVVFSIINLNNIISIYGFQLIVGIYMIEVVGMISIFTSIIDYGEEPIMRLHNLGKTLAISIAIYSAILLIIYFTFNSLVPVSTLT